MKRQNTSTPDCSTTGATNLGTFNVSNGSVPPSNVFTIPNAGTLEFWAVYSGDANNNGQTSTCGSETVTVTVHPGTLGYWRNWRNHFTSTQFQVLINYLKANNPKVYNKDLVLNNADDLTVAKVDKIFLFGTKIPKDQMILAQLTAAKFNLAITQLEGTGGLVQQNDDICLAGTVDVSSISGATALFGTSTPTIKQIVDLVEGRWTGNLTTTRSNWTFSGTNAQKTTIIGVLDGINNGNLVSDPGLLTREGTEGKYRKGRSDGPPLPYGLC